jgi:protein-disulfide isomerase
MQDDHGSAAMKIFVLLAGALLATAAPAAAQSVPASPLTLSTMSNPPAKIASADVLDAQGRTIGAVQEVEVTPQGQPTAVAVAVLGKTDQILVLDAGKVQYDPATNRIVARQGRGQGLAGPG